MFAKCLNASLLISLYAFPALAEEGNRVSALRGMLDKWIEVQKAITKEKSDAGSAKQLLVQRTELLTREVEDLQKKKTESEAGITEADAKRAELVAKKELIVQSLAELEKELPQFEAEMRALQPLLPDPVKEKLAPLFGRIPEPDKAAKVSLAERFQNIVGILNEVNKANLEINLVSEIRPLSGKPTEVKTLYVGLAQAYFVNATGKLAGVGRPGPNGWVWEQQDALAKEIRGAIGMLQSKSAAKFISVPVHVD